MADRFITGDTVSLTNTFKVAGVATNPTAVSLVVTNPAGTATTYTYAADITRSATGVYTIDVVCPTAGIWSYKWTGTGAAADVETGQFEVHALDPQTTPGLALPADLEAYTGLTIDTARARLLIDLASGAIRAHTGQTLSRVTNDAVTLPGNHDNSLTLPERPASAPTLVKIGDTTLTVDTDYVFDGRWTLYRGTKVDGVLSVNGPDYLIDGWGDWGGPGAVVSITYTHGFATIPADIKGVCLALAARSLQSPDGVNSETVGSYSVSYSRTGGAVSLLDEERKLLDRYRVRVFA